jgi:hypothetical protein
MQQYVQLVKLIFWIERIYRMEVWLGAALPG